MLPLEPTGGDPLQQRHAHAFELRVLGPFELVLRPSGDIIPVQTAKMRALLTYLAAAPRLTETRGRLASLLWETRDEAQARSSLRQMLSNFRRGPGTRTLTAINESSVGIDPLLVRIDHTALINAPAVTDIAGLLAIADLYRGDFGVGLEIDELEFDTWLHAEQIRCRQAAIALLDRLVRTLADLGRHDEALQRANRLTEIDPLREVTHRLVIAEEAIVSGRASAMQRYETFRLLLRDELGVRPETATLQLLDELRGQATNRPALPLLQEIPPPGPGPRFQIGERGLIERVPLPEIGDGNDDRTINQLKPLALRCASELRMRLSRNEFPELLITVEQYEAALKPGSGRAIEWGEVWGLGVMLQNAATAVERRIADALMPSLEDAAKTSLDTLLKIHGPLILATKDGATLDAIAQRFAMTREQASELRVAAEEVSQQLTRRQDIITPSAARSIASAVSTIEQGSHPERGTIYALATVKNVAVVLIGAAAAATPAIMGALLGAPLAGAVTAAPISLLVVEAVKKNPSFIALLSRLNSKIDKIPDREFGTWLQRQLHELAPFRTFVIANEQSLRTIAESTTELRWMLRYIDFVVRNP